MNVLAHSRSRNAGYALIIMMIAVALLLISLTAALPSLYQQGQREREKEAIFCANQYARAIYLFYRKFGRYPTSVKDLLNTSGIRFLRQPYPDPLSPTGRWRFVHVAAGGILIDSWNQSTLTPGPIPGMGAPAGTATLGNRTGNNNTGMSGNGGGFGIPGAPASSGGLEATQNGKAKHPPSTCDSNQGQASFSGTTYQTGMLLGAYIAGVAPCSDNPSIIVVNHHSHYEHWEFLALNYKVYGLPKSANVGKPVQPASPGLSGTSNQEGNPSGNALNSGQLIGGQATPQ